YTSTVTQFKEPPKKRPVNEITVETLSAVDEPAAEQPLIWRNIIGIFLLHAFAIYSLATRYHEAKWQTWIFSPLWGIAAGVGITGGAHRLWAHRSYSAKVPLRILLAYLYCMAGQNGVKFSHVRRSFELGYL
ncbi:hypothetical protein G9C98_004164, partial [Cotesia typhae]